MQSGGTLETDQRLFFALDPPPSVRQRMADLQTGLDLPGRVVPPRNFHVTLVFLGNVPAADIGRLLQTANRTPGPACRITLDRLGRFSRSGVVWLGCSSFPESLLDFQQRLHERLCGVGFSGESRGWAPHVTLYRNLRKPFAKIPFEVIDWQLKGYCLMQSSAAPGGPEYLPIGHWETVRVGD